MNHESQWRTIVKSLSWRAIASFTTFSISWFITGNVSAGLIIGGIDFALKLLFYYLHERSWSHIDWGLVPFSKK